MSSIHSSQQSKDKMTAPHPAMIPIRAVQGRATATPSTDHSAPSATSELNKSTSSSSSGRGNTPSSQRGQHFSYKSSSFQPFSSESLGLPDLSAMGFDNQLDKKLLKEGGESKESERSPLSHTVWSGNSSRSSQQSRTPYTSSSYTVKTPASSTPFTPYTPTTSKSSIPVTPLTPWSGIPSSKTADKWSTNQFDETSLLPPLPRLSLVETPIEVGRHLQITGIPKYVTNERINDFIEVICDHHAIVYSFRESKGFIIVVCTDSREAKKVCDYLERVPSVFSAPGSTGEVRCSSMDKASVAQICRNHSTLTPLLDVGESAVVVTIDGPKPAALCDMQNLMQQFGDIRSIHTCDMNGFSFEVDFFITTSAAKSIRALNGKVLNEQSSLRIEYKSEPIKTNRETLLQQASQGYTLGSAAYKIGIFGDASRDGHQDQKTREPDVFGTRPDPQGPAFPESTGNRFAKHRSLPQDFGRPRLDEEARGNFYTAPPTPSHFDTDERRLSEPGLWSNFGDPAVGGGRFQQGTSGHARFANPNQAIPEANRVFADRILSGLDNRTTVMVKDVPNKLSRQELVNILAEVVPGEFDFVYLRFDFRNCCNVGYAFVNFTSVRALYAFIQARVGQKWNLFSSEKVLQISYANIQGKQALINKFRNSAVMGVIEPWRPQIFYGSKQGQPEPFPGADNQFIARRSHDAQLTRLSGPATPTHEIDAYNYDYASSTFNDGYGF